MKKLKGTLKRSDLEGGAWVFESEDGQRYHLNGLPGNLERDGARLEVEGEEGSSMGIGMMGSVLEVRSARAV